jgi:hypothetical protein
MHGPAPASLRLRLEACAANPATTTATPVHLQAATRLQPGWRSCDQAATRLVQLKHSCNQAGAAATRPMQLHPGCNPAGAAK